MPRLVDIAGAVGGGGGIGQDEAELVGVVAQPVRGGPGAEVTEGDGQVERGAELVLRVAGSGGIAIGGLGVAPAGGLHAEERGLVGRRSEAGADVQVDAVTGGGVEQGARVVDDQLAQALRAVGGQAARGDADQVLGLVVVGQGIVAGRAQEHLVGDVGRQAEDAA